MSSSTKVTKKEPEKVPYASGTTNWPNGSPMTAVEISAVHSKSINHYLYFFKNGDLRHSSFLSVKCTSIYYGND